MKSIELFLEGLCNIPEGEFDISHVMRYIRDNRVDPDSLTPYVLYAPTHYTRNLIYRCENFELMTICWEIGQVSPIHNHQNQKCWMAVPIGRLAVQNYKLIDDDPQSCSCVLREADRVEMDCRNPSYVHPEQPIHSVLNLPEYGQRAVSLHIYSRPYSHCLVYSPESGSYRDVPLFYDSEYGRLRSV